jgi:hypothetical protein
MGKYGFILGCILLFSSVFGFVHWMKQYESEVTTTPVLMAKKYIPAHTVITSDMLYVQSIDSRLKNTNAFHDAKLVVGKETAIPIGTNEQFVRWKIDERNLLPNRGESYFTFKSDAISTVANMIRRGDYVQIWLEVDSSVMKSEFSEHNQTQIPGALLVIDQAKVAYVKDAQGQEVTDKEPVRVDPFFYGKKDVHDRKDHDQSRTNATGDIVSITYIFTEQQYERIIRAQRFGKLKMGLSWQFQTELDHATTSATVLKRDSEYDFEIWMDRLRTRENLDKEGI